MIMSSTMTPPPLLKMPHQRATTILVALFLLAQSVGQTAVEAFLPSSVTRQQHKQYSAWSSVGVNRVTSSSILHTRDVRPVSLGQQRASTVKVDIGAGVQERRRCRAVIISNIPSTTTTTLLQATSSGSASKDTVLPKRETALEEKWNAVFKRLEEYKKQHGNINVKQRYNDGKQPHLGVWLNTQRQAYRKRTLSADKISKLESLGVVWKYTSTEISQQQRDDEKWNNTYTRLLQYKEEYGNATVPTYYNDGKEPHLGKWVMNQREDYRTFQRTNGRAGAITQERIDRLNAVGFVWEDARQAEYDQLWSQYFHELVAFKQKYNSTKVPVPKLSLFEDPLIVLGGWAKEQRDQLPLQMCNKTSSLTQERTELLNSIGFSWSLQNKTDHEKWLFQYFKLYFHQREYNNTVVTDSDVYNSRFVNWVAKQKLDYHKGALDQLKIDRLNDLNFDWALDPEPSWDEYYAELCDYHAQYNTTLLNIRINSNLAKWTKEQRRLHKKNLLEAERIAKLNMLHFDWDPDDPDWDAMYHRLLAYKRKHGNVVVPYKYVEDPPLAEWVQRQRTTYTQFLGKHAHIGELLIKQVATHLATKRLPAEVHAARLTSLVDVGFVWSALEAQWLEMYQMLVVYKQHTNSTLVPYRYEKDPQLGSWVAKQRERKLEGLISARQLELLGQIGFVWDPIGDRWNEMFERLCEYKERHGDPNVPYRYSADLELGCWVVGQRQLYKEERLSSDRIRKLESIGFETKTCWPHLCKASPAA